MEPPPPSSMPPSQSAPPRPVPEVGDTLGGKYKITRLLGQGSMAVVLEATHLRLRQKVAIKVLLPRYVDSKETSIRFDREARAAVSLRGPNVARVYDVETTDGGLPYIVMEVLDGRDLAAEMDARGPIPVEEAVDIILGVCSAMHEAHAAGVVHRDLKPANVFLVGATSPLAGAAPRRITKVLDFGISKLLDAETNVTESEVLLGTPVYMSPEQIEAAKRVDARTDIWSIGVILYEMLASERPFEGKNTIAAIRAITNDPPKPLDTRRPETPPELVAAIMKALAKSPDDRFPDIAALAQALAPFGSAKTWAPPDLTASTQPAIRSLRPGKAGRKLPLIWLVAAAIVIVALAILATRK
jgi:serine/threonine protein kinase